MFASISYFWFSLLKPHSGQMTWTAWKYEATVLIENIFAAFEMDEILSELRHHLSGLNWYVGLYGVHCGQFPPPI